MLIGDGLSGTYQNTEGGECTLEDSGHIHVLNTKTLVAPGKSGPDPQRAGEQDQLNVNKQKNPGIQGSL